MVKIKADAFIAIFCLAYAGYGASGPVADLWKAYVAFTKP